MGVDYFYRGKDDPINQQLENRSPVVVAAITLFLFCLAALFIAGCVSIPKETALLNVHLGNQIAETKKTNIGLIENWADVSKKNVHNVFKYWWIPQYIKKFLDQPEVKTAIDEEFCKLKEGKLGRAILVQEIIEDLTGIIEAERNRLLNAIEDERVSLLNAVLNHYADLERVHGNISANVQSAVKGLELEKAIREAALKPLNKIVPLEEAGKKIESLIEMSAKGVK